MNIFKWMQNRLNGTNGKMKPSSFCISTDHMVSESYKQEFSDWDQAILAIGTFGNNNLNEDSNKSIDEEDSYSVQDFTQELSFEEVGNFQNDLIMNFEESGNSYPSNKLIYDMGRESLDKGNKIEVSKQSLSFLLKKMFVCGGEYLPPTSVFKDPLSTESRTEKILRAILHKKIHPHGSCSTTFNKYLENNSMPESDYEDGDEYEYEYEKELATSDVEKGCKWVKTDSEYIVLEI